MVAAKDNSDVFSFADYCPVKQPPSLHCDEGDPALCFQIIDGKYRMMVLPSEPGARAALDQHVDRQVGSAATQPHAATKEQNVKAKPLKRASLASGTRVQSSASFLGHTIMLAPPMAVFGCLTVGAWIAAPLVVKHAETALEDAAWAVGRVWAGGVALTHIFEGPTRHNTIAIDTTVQAEPPRPSAPIIIVPRPDIGAPTLSPRRGGRPIEDKPSRKRHRTARQPQASGLPPEQTLDAVAPSPVPQGEPKGDTP